MKRYADLIKGTIRENPFGDYQGSRFSSEKVYTEFCPTSSFWSLFNAQHEIILGARGSGKTFLLKMMRYSMLKKISDPNALKIISERKFFALYIPMHLEFVTTYYSAKLPEEVQIALFQVKFNCLLAQSLLFEIKSVLEDIVDSKERIGLSIKLFKKLNEVWFNNEAGDSFDLSELSHKINTIYYNIQVSDIMNDSKIPVVFKSPICTVLVAVKSIIEEILGYNDLTWIICIDEAEFLNEILLRCINNVFRSDSNRIALKVATLPFYHSTFETLKKGTYVNEGNDFNFHIIDLNYKDNDFIRLTNKICYTRLRGMIEGISEEDALEKFLGTIGKDDLIDYYRYEVGVEISQKEIEDKIIANFSERRRKSVQAYTDKRKTIYDKYAPIFFTREMYKKSCDGNSKPGWFAGAKTVRKVSQGNPRLFIHLMSELYAMATKRKLTPKAQHEAVCDFAKNICEATLALEAQGPIVYYGLKSIAVKLHDLVHGGSLKTVGSAFKLRFSDEADFLKNRTWIELAIAHSRLIVDDTVLKGCLKPDSQFCLAAVFSVQYWLPIRSDTPQEIGISNIQLTNSYSVDTGTKREKKDNNGGVQLSLFGGEDDTDV